MSGCLKGCSSLVLFLAIGLGGLVVFEMATTAPKPADKTAKDVAKPQESDFRMAARSKAKQHVEAILKSPSTADFPWFDWQVTKADQAKDIRYVVYSYVDSQNGFGATVRTKFRVVVRFNGGDPKNLNNWEVVNFNQA